MNLAGIDALDIVFVEIRGRGFYAEVQGRPLDDGVLPIEPIGHNNSHRHVEAHDIKRHYRRMGRPRRHKRAG